jgi:uncharacterized membrane protein (DUF4010 family)
VEVGALDLFQRLGLALAIGLLIGLERGWHEREQGEGTRTAGFRTFALIGLLGGVWGALTPELGPVPLSAAGLGFAAAFILFEWREGVARNDFSVTSTIAGLLVFAIGVYAVLGNRAVAAAAGVVTMALLAARRTLHGFLRRLTWPELRSAIVLLAMTFLLLPILPDRTIDPWDAVNPHALWLMIVLIAAISFFGYVAVRVLGPDRGVLVSAATGALISSTTVTLNHSRLAAHERVEHASLIVAILVAWIVSLARMSAIAIAVNPMLLTPLAAPILSAMAVLALAGFALYGRSASDHLPKTEGLRHPLDLQFVLGFGALLAAITVAMKALTNAFGSAGALTLAGLAGFVDVDPVTLSSARLAGSTLKLEAAAEAIMLAAAANMVTKMAVTLTVGGVKFGWRLALAGALAIAAGVAAMIATSGA